jgi:glucosamine-6-phosphate deaminase
MIARIKPQFVLGLAQGDTPASSYNALAHRVRSGRLSLRHASGFAMTEYVGLAPNDRKRQAAAIHRRVTVPLAMNPASIYVPDGASPDADQEASDYDLRIRHAGGIDLQLLGIASNGAIGFNQPGSSATSSTRVVRVDESDGTPSARIFVRRTMTTRLAITEGVGTIMQARSVAVVAIGEEKARALKSAIEGPLGPHSPATFLRLHPNITFYCDAAAASGLRDTSTGW